MSKKRREKCPECSSLHVISHGNRSGHQRYKCKNCGKVFTFRRRDISEQNRFVWFKWWILKKQTITQVSELSGHSVRQLSRWFNEYLEQYPEWEIQRREKVNLLIDGSWFPNKMCLIVYRDDKVKKTLFYRVTDDEWEEEIREDIENLLSAGVEIESVTSDGGRNIIKAVKKACPEAIRQRCLAHIQRECLIWITKYPQSNAGKDLRRIVCLISKIKFHNDRMEWQKLFAEWSEIYQEYLNEKSFKADTHREWYTHKMVRKAYIHIKKAMPDMFHFLDNPNIPKTTNALESFFGHLKENISLHRGMTKRHSQNYVKWYLYFRNLDNKEKNMQHHRRNK